MPDTRERDPLVTLWQDSGRPLHWRAWRGLTPAEQARLRWLLSAELWQLDQRCPTTSWAWRQTHRELLELKAASGHVRDEGGRPG